MNNKNINSRNDMNDKMLNFTTPNYLNKNNANIHSQDFKTSSILYDKNNIKNDINTRLNNFRDLDNIHLRRLPFNNNIRDYVITVDSKRDEVNDRLSNYNRLSSNMNPTISNINTNSFSFHNNFKDDNNKRMQDLSPLSRNVGMPIHTEPPSLPDFNKNLDNNNYYSYNSNNSNIQDKDESIQYNNYQENYNENNFENKNTDKPYNITGSENNLNNYTLLDDGINKINSLNYERLNPCNSRHTYNFK